MCISCRIPEPYPKSPLFGGRRKLGGGSLICVGSAWLISNSHSRQQSFFLPPVWYWSLVCVGAFTRNSPTLNLPGSHMPKLEPTLNMNAFIMKSPELKVRDENWFQMERLVLTSMDFGNDLLMHVHWFGTAWRAIRYVDGYFIQIWSETDLSTDYR